MDRNDETPPHEDGDRPGWSLPGSIHRRRALAWLAGAGTFALLTACGSDGDGLVTVPPTPSPTPSPTPTPVPPPTPTPPGPEPICAPTPAETSGPYPADGTNTSSGSTSNVLVTSGIQRSDIRSSFIDTTTVAAGVQLTLTITVLDGDACTALGGRAVYIWQADAHGLFSLYTIPQESYLRGLGLTNGEGKVTFTTIVPGCLADRFPHIYVEVFPDLFSSNRGSNADLTTQLIVPAEICQAAYADSTTYPGSATNLAGVSIASDPVFGDDSTQDNGARTLSVAGSVSAGFTSEVSITLPADT